MAHRLLIIDDNEEVLVSLYNYFIAKNFDVTSASNGLDALKLIESDQEVFDLIITDLVMPTVSGVGIISIVKKKSPDIPIIAITGWGEHPEALAKEARADVVLEKPVELSDLEAMVRELLDRKKPS